MIALIWKELRENFKWALLAMLALGGAEFYGLHHSLYAQPEFYDYPNREITLCKRTFLTVTTYGPAIVGLLLGFLQVLPELKRDRWAALLHRPVSRGTIFFGKAIAGGVLYFIGAVIPFLGCIWVTATPGHFPAPFVPGIALPGTADTCTGFLYYWAALAVALQRSGPRLLRFLPLLAALHVSSFITSTYSFAAAIAAGAFLSLALGIAAWGAMQHQWSFSARPWLARLALLIATFYGLCGLNDFIRFFALAGSNSFTETRYELTDQGMPVKIRYVKGSVVSVQDLEGKAPEEIDYKPERIRNHLTYLNSCASYIGDPHGLDHGWESHYYYRQVDSYLRADYPLRYPRLEQWFYLVAERSAVGFLPLQKIPGQRLGAGGFDSASAAPAPFPADVTVMQLGQGGYCLWNKQGARLAKVASRKIIELALPVPSPVYGVAQTYARTGNGQASALTVALSTAVAVYDREEGKLVATLPYHQDMDRWGAVSVGMDSTEDRFYVWYRPSDWIPWKTQKAMPAYLEEVNASGAVLHAYTLPPLPAEGGPLPWIDKLEARLKSPVFFYGDLLYEKVGAARGNKNLGYTLAWELGEGWPHTRRIAIWVTALSFLLAGITLWWARRAHFSSRQAWSWAAVAFGFNIAGFLLFRLVADWPRLVPCSACQRPRPIDHESCPHCQEGWAAHRPNGTEIFDHQTDLAMETTA